MLMAISRKQKSYPRSAGRKTTRFSVSFWKMCEMFVKNLLLLIMFRELFFGPILNGFWVCGYGRPPPDRFRKKFLTPSLKIRCTRIGLFNPLLGSVRRYYIVIAFSARAVWCIVFLWDATDFFPSVLPNEHLLMCTSGWKCAQAMRQMNANLHDLCRKTPPHLFGPCNFNSAKKAPNEKILECEETTWGDENYTRWISELPEIMSAGRNPGAGGCRTLVIYVSSTVLTPPVSTHLL